MLEIMTADTARFLLGLLNAQQLSIGSPDFDEALTKVLNARRELAAIIEKEEVDAAS